MSISELELSVSYDFWQCPWALQKAKSLGWVHVSTSKIEKIRKSKQTLYLNHAGLSFLFFFLNSTLWPRSNIVDHEKFQILCKINR